MWILSEVSTDDPACRLFERASGPVAEWKNKRATFMGSEVFAAWDGDLLVWSCQRDGEVVNEGTAPDGRTARLRAEEAARDAAAEEAR